MTWFTDRRLDFIEDCLVDRGWVTYKDLVHYFGVSRHSAGVDFLAYQRQQPLFGYHPVYEAYMPQPGYQPVRGSSLKRRKAWGAFLPPP